MKRTHWLLGTGAAILAIVAVTAYWIGSQWSHPDIRAAVASRSDSASEGRRVLYWYDPMNPQQRFDRPGKSPFMDMELTPKYADEGEDAGTIRIDPSVTQNLGVRLAVVERVSLSLA